MRFAVLVSGSGTNLQALLDADAHGELSPGTIALVISNRPGVKALDRADGAGIPRVVIDHKAFDDRKSFEQAVLDTLRDGREKLRRESAELQGTLQVAMPSDLGRNVMLQWLTEFRRQHPALNLRLFVSDQMADMFRDPVDVAIRSGVIEDANYIALPLAPWNRRVLVASPDYLARKGRLSESDDLLRHDCLQYILNGRVYDKWPVGGRVLTVSGPLLTDDADLVRRWAVAGEGIAYKSWVDVRDDVLAGRLELLLPDYPGEPAPVNLVYPHRKQFSPAVQQLHSMLKSRFVEMEKGLPKLL